LFSGIEEDLVQVNIGEKMITKIQLEDAIAQLLQYNRPTITFSENGLTVSKDGKSQVLRGIQRNNSGNVISLR
jgi:hypothetical protein